MPFGTFDQEDEKSLSTSLGGNASWALQNKGLASTYGNIADRWKTKFGTDLTADMVKDVADKGGLEGLTSTLGPASTGENSLSSWFGDKGNQAMLQTGFGAANLGLGLASYLQQSDFMKKQGNLLDQQLASNQYEMDRRQGFSNAMASNARSAG